MKQRLYILRFIDDNGLVFKYKTGAGNYKKALFNTVKHAEKVADDINDGEKIVYVDSID